MIELQLDDVKKGRQRVVASLLTLAVVRLAVTLFYYLGLGEVTMPSSFLEFRDIFVLEVPVILLMGAGTFRGSKPIRYILVATLVITFLLELSLFLNGFPDPILQILLISDWLIRAVVIYFLLFDSVVADFFLYQRAKNYGEWMAVKVADQEQQEKPEPKARKKGSDALEEMEGEEEEVVEKKGKKKKPRPNWEDELGIFEE